MNYRQHILFYPVGESIYLFIILKNKTSPKILKQGELPKFPSSAPLKNSRVKRMPRRKAAEERPTAVPAPQQSPEIGDMEDLFIDTEIKQIRVSLRGWYGLNRRDLPWRQPEEDVEKRAYRVWVSEVMLQQTRVQTVIRYFERWTNKWPTIRHLSQASLEVLPQKHKTFLEKLLLLLCHFHLLWLLHQRMCSAGGE